MNDVFAIEKEVDGGGGDDDDFTSLHLSSFSLGCLQLCAISDYNVPFLVEKLHS